MVSDGNSLSRHCLTHRVGFRECGWVTFLMILESCAVRVVYINIKYI